jgi:hypothetical protein
MKDVDNAVVDNAVGAPDTKNRRRSQYAVEQNYLKTAVDVIAGSRQAGS